MCAELHPVVAILLVVSTRAAHDGQCWVVSKCQDLEGVGGPLKQAACIGFRKWRGHENACLGFIKLLKE